MQENKIKMVFKNNTHGSSAQKSSVVESVAIKSVGQRDVVPGQRVQDAADVVLVPPVRERAERD